jgi:hypothetical protein
METFPPGGWDIARPNVVSWYADLGTIEPSSTVNGFRDALFQLGRRFDGLNRVITHNDAYDEAEDVKPMRSRSKKAQADVNLYMENMSSVSRQFVLLFS